MEKQKSNWDQLWDKFPYIVGFLFIGLVLLLAFLTVKQ
jgi:hypothetical protein